MPVERWKRGASGRAARPAPVRRREPEAGSWHGTLRPRLVAALLAAHAVGCALTAEKPPTPAAEIPAGALEYPAPPNERYYVLVFGSQQLPLLRPAKTHTWMVVVKATCVEGCAEPQLDVQQISWLPATLEINPLRFKVEPPVNLGLARDDPVGAGDRPEDRDVGAVRGAAAGVPPVPDPEGVPGDERPGRLPVHRHGRRGRPGGNGCDCIHAITDLDPQFDRARYPLVFYGQPASRRLVHEAARRQAFIDPWTTHDWLIPKLGLDQYPIDRREQPYKGIRRPIDPATGGRTSVQSL